VLTDVVLGKRLITRSSTQSWCEIYHGLVPIEIDGWHLTLFNDCDSLDYWEYCRSPDGRVGTLELWQRDGADHIQDWSYGIIFIKDDCRQALVGLPGFLRNPGNCQSAMQP
jgi:hypothetical protein